ncbi:ABC transporter permease [Streptomyces sp. ME19-01-6]|uniref:ABC transporter permease n=1 Tax=Streptomyces sp. ME19-01-6 TaxID=3028686 RepID=UPI0029A91E25|nr:ABC transporter permease [Streptomyces sp. ME19-01-6]MDX3230403.1 ABC transporter permease [Streptomyces sp. ME19-01-6]
MRLLLTAFVFQLRLSGRSPDTFQVCVTAPLLSAVFLTVSEYSGRGDLASYAVVAPTLMSLWTLALSVAGTAITEDRILGTLEGQIAAPAPMAVVLLGRMCSVAVVGLIAFVETWLVAGVGFGRWLAVPHPLALCACLLATGLATAATAGLLSPLFVLTPTARTVQSTLSYPFYLLGGVLVPPSFLPDWLQPVTRIIFLSWCADLLRDSLDAPAVSHLTLRLAAIVSLGAVACGVGMLLLRHVIVWVRRSGTLVHT